jgi:hypothetical protein
MLPLTPTAVKTVSCYVITAWRVGFDDMRKVALLCGIRTCHLLIVSTRSSCGSIDMSSTIPSAYTDPLTMPSRVHATSLHPVAIQSPYVHRERIRKTGASASEAKGRRQERRDRSKHRLYTLLRNNKGHQSSVSVSRGNRSPCQELIPL